MEGTWDIEANNLFYDFKTKKSEIKGSFPIKSIGDSLFIIDKPTENEFERVAHNYKSRENPQKSNELQNEKQHQESIKSNNRIVSKPNPNKSSEDIRRIKEILGGVWESKNGEKYFFYEQKGASKYQGSDIEWRIEGDKIHITHNKTNKTVPYLLKVINNGEIIIGGVRFKRNMVYDKKNPNKRIIG